MTKYKMHTSKQATMTITLPKTNEYRVIGFREGTQIIGGKGYEVYTDLCVLVELIENNLQELGISDYLTNEKLTEYYTRDRCLVKIWFYSQESLNLYKLLGSYNDNLQVDFGLYPIFNDHRDFDGSKDEYLR